MVFHLLILSHHQANTWLNRLVLHGALKPSLLGFLLSWEGKWIFYASVEDVLPPGSWNSDRGMVSRSILADFIYYRAPQKVHDLQASWTLTLSCAGFSPNGEDSKALFCWIMDVSEQRFCFIFLVSWCPECTRGPLPICFKEDFCVKNSTRET